MLNFIFIYLYFIQFYLLFSLSTKTPLKLAFTNYNNLIRCSENELQYYSNDVAAGVHLPNIVECQNKDEIIDSHYTIYAWLKIELKCSSDNKYVRERITIVNRGTNPSDDTYKLPKPETKSITPKVDYELKIVEDLDSTIVLESNEILVDTMSTSLDARYFILWFPNHPIICVIVYKTDEKTVCGENEANVQLEELMCYYDLEDNTKPSIDLFMAERLQLVRASRPNSQYYLLNLPKPVCVSR